nr:anhydro-N-acetylmuramic acid kinase [Deinobacterium chartae]
MSGTSADGVDAVRVRLSGFGYGPGGWRRGQVKLLAHAARPYPAELRAQVLAAMRSELTTRDLAQLHYDLGEVLAAAALEVSAGADLIASHGQTVYHIPELDRARGWHTRATWQLGEASVIAEATGIDVMADFRPADLAAGGQAAPLVPFADWLRFARTGERVAVHNLGGISNLTYLPGDDPAGVIAFDTGPANCLLDELAARAGLQYDPGGEIAARGRVHTDLLADWLAADSYLRLPPPKSTGRERYHLRALTGLEALPLEDALATATAFVAQSVAGAYRDFLPDLPERIVLAGGGARNATLVREIASRLPEVQVTALEPLEAQTREAVAFALLGYAGYLGLPNVLPGTTGARRAVIAGKLTRAAL